jgi:hypothetical protein
MTETEKSSSNNEIRKGYIKGLNFDFKPIEYQVINGLAIFEGDIILGTAEEMEELTKTIEGKTKGIIATGGYKRWPGQLIPYQVDSNLPNPTRISDAIAHWQQNTGIRFVQRTGQNAGSYPNYVRFLVGTDNCSSQIGMAGGEQKILLAAGCLRGQVIHEIGHAVGLWHEQSREDRDHSVKINWQNILSGKENNFNQHIADGDDIGEYDFDSIMHYGAYDFSKNGLPTIEPLKSGVTIGQRNGLSKGDLAAVREIYPMRAPLKSLISAASRSKDKLDVFTVGKDGGIFTAAWEPSFSDWWHGWWRILNLEALAGTPLSAVSRNTNKLDIFVVDKTGRVCSAAWEPAFADGWHGWWHIKGGMAKPGSPVTAVSRATDWLDIFVVGTDGGVYSASWNPAFSDGWHGWWRIGDISVTPGSWVTVASRGPNNLDIFVTGKNGNIYTAAWGPQTNNTWKGWWQVKDLKAPQGAPVNAISRSADKLDIFVVANDGGVYTAAWEPAFADGWHGWWKILNLQAAPGSYVSVVSRSKDKLDIFATDKLGKDVTAAWEPSFKDWFHGWWQIREGTAPAGSPISAVSRSADKLDIFVVGGDERIYTAAWEPTFKDGWHGWWRMP